MTSVTGPRRALISEVAARFQIISRWMNEVHADALKGFAVGFDETLLCSQNYTRVVTALPAGKSRLCFKRALTGCRREILDTIYLSFGPLPCRYTH